jgi:hypothetical protein
MGVLSVLPMANLLPAPGECCDPPTGRAQCDRGEGPVSYLAVLLLLSLVATAVFSTGVPEAIGGGIQQAVCRVSDDDCENEPQAGRPPSSPRPSAPASSATGDAGQGRRPSGATPGMPHGILAARGASGDQDDTVPPPWADGGTPCWNFECEYVEDPVPLDAYDPNNLPENWDIDSTSHLPSRFDWEEDECVEHCARFNEEIWSRMRACMGGVTGFFRGAFNACDRNDMEHELVRDIEADREEYLDEHPEVRASLEALDAIEANNGATLPPGALNHIWERHGPGTTQPRSRPAGKFADGTTQGQVRDMIDRAVRNGTPRPNTLDRPGVRFEYDFGRNIGVNIRGRPSSTLRVIVGTHGGVITAYPI